MPERPARKAPIMGIKIDTIAITSAAIPNASMLMPCLRFVVGIENVVRGLVGIYFFILPAITKLSFTWDAIIITIHFGAWTVPLVESGLFA